MALVKCRECSKPISSDARFCPHCGAKPSYRPSATFVLIAGLLILFAVKAGFDANKQPVQKREKTTEEVAADLRTKMAYVVIRKIKQNLREPESLDVINVFSSEKADLLCVKYRAKNGFGGYSIEYYVIGEFGDSDSIKAWNAYCTSEMYNVTAVKHLL